MSIMVKLDKHQIMEIEVVFELFGNRPRDKGRLF